MSDSRYITTDPLKVEITSRIAIQREYGTVSFCWTNQSTDYWHPSSEEEDELTQEKAEELIAFLKDHFKL
jgi:hypothetical protein